MANRYPLVVDTTNGNKIREIPNGDNLQLTGNSVIGVVDVTASGTVSANEINATSIKKGGTELATVAVTGAFSDITGGPTQLSDLTDDLNVLVPGDNVGTLTNNVGYLTTVAFTDLTTTPTTLAGYGITDAATTAQGGLAATAVQPGASVSVLVNDAGYLTLADIQNGAVTIDVNNTGDLVGSVFGDDSTVLVDSILSAVNLDGTIRGHVRPNANQHNLWDLGTNAVRFKDAYFAGTINGALVGTLDGDMTGSVFGDDSTLLVDAVNNKIVGAVETSSLRTSETKIALGSSAGVTTQGIEAIAIGKEAGKNTQGDDAVAVGSEAGEIVQGASSVAIGKQAGYNNQSADAVAVGAAAGNIYQGDSAVALGKTAGYDNQGDNAVAVGYGAGSFTQGDNATALGNSTGYTGQGADAIAIGYQAGYSNQAANSIVINATGNILNNTQADAFVVKPIRSASGTTTLMYDATTGEVTHTATPAQQTMIGSVQQISGPGAIDVTSYITEITTTGTDDAYTLADGVAGQIKIICMVVDGGDAIITPTTLATGTTITMADVNDNITLLYGANGWVNTANQGSIIA